MNDQLRHSTAAAGKSSVRGNQKGGQIRSLSKVPTPNLSNTERVRNTGLQDWQIAACLGKGSAEEVQAPTVRRHCLVE